MEEEVSMDDIKVYMIANLQIHDINIYRQYEKGFFQILKRHSGEFITYDDNVDHIEGDNKVEGRVILFSFPSKSHAEAWYADEDYQALSEHRRAATTSTITRISGLPERK